MTGGKGSVTVTVASGPEFHFLNAPDRGQKVRWVMFKVVSMSKVQLVAIQGRGRGMSDFTANCLLLNVGEGVRISQAQYNRGKGVASVYSAGHRRNMTFKVRRDVKGHIWLFRVKPLAVAA